MWQVHPFTEPQVMMDGAMNDLIGTSFHFWAHIFEYD